MANVMQLMSQFPQFMAANRGKNPNQILNEMISSGRITQQQLNQAQQMASRMGTQFDAFREMFGFRR